MCNEARTDTEVSFDENDIQKAISRLNSGKSADEFGIDAEHFKAAGSHVLPLIVTLFNDILRNGEVPDSFKSGILTPLHKKDKDPTSLDNYRGITVSKRPRGRAVSAPDFGSRGRAFESRWRRDSFRT